MITKFLDKLKSYIEISNFERRGVFALLFSCLLIAGYYYFKNSRPSHSVDISKEELAAYEAHIDSAFQQRSQRDIYPTKDKYKRKVSDEVSYLPFNPDIDSEAQLLKAGLRPYVVKSLMKFRAKGGGFKQKSDFKKLYLVNDELYSKVEPFILLPDENSHKGKYKEEFIEKESREKPSELNINRLTVEDLKDLPGIGDFYAKQILEYRVKLGGYINKEQLREVYKMREESAIEIEGMFTYNQDVIRIKVNTATFKQLLAHPYLDFKQVKALVNYRAQHGAYSSESDLRKLHLLSDEDVDRILPYLDLN